jgi:hemerythrin superfamily protein
MVRHYTKSRAELGVFPQTKSLEKEDTQHQVTLVLDSRLRGNDRVSSFLEFSLED